MAKLGIWGRALALRLPSHIIHAAQLKLGTEVTCRLLDDGSIRVKLQGLQANSAAGAEPAVVEAPAHFGDKSW
jgi:antitoxin component of MazEF toxin-antitoxin module